MTRFISLFAFYKPPFYKKIVFIKKPLMEKLSKSEIKKIIKDELDNFAKNQLDKEMKSLLAKSSSQTRKESLEITKMALAAFAKYMWIRKSVWQADIR